MEENRRDFLKKFVLLSSVPIMFNGCSPNAVYGPPPTTEQTIIYYRDKEGNLLPLHQKEKIPLDVSIIIEFPNKMDSESKNTVNLTDEKDIFVSCKKEWKDEYILELEPIEGGLEYNMNYIITIDKAIQDKEGNLLEENEYSLIAKFTTQNNKPK